LRGAACPYKALCLVKSCLNAVLLTLRGDLRRRQRRTSQHLVEPALSRNSSGFQDARAAPIVVFSAITETPVLGGAEDGRDAGLGLDSVGLPVIATVARLLCPSATEPRPLTPSRWDSRSRGRPGPFSTATAGRAPAQRGCLPPACHAHRTERGRNAPLMGVPPESVPVRYLLHMRGLGLSPSARGRVAFVGRRGAGGNPLG